MSVLTKIFGHPKATYRGVAARAEDCCYGRELMPRWRGPDEMQDDSKAMGFVCHACGSEYPPYQVRNRRLIRTE